MILVTGATGLVGSHLVRALRAEERPVRILVRSGSRLDALWPLGVEPVEGDLEHPQSLDGAVRGVESVLHAAARVVVHGDEERVLAVNLEGTLSLARAARQAGVRRFVFLSSVAVYGRSGEGAVDEDSALEPSGAYSRSKVESERALLAMHAAGELDVRIVRPCIIYGPGDRHFLPSLLPALRLPVVPLPGGGRALTSLVHAADVARATLLSWSCQAASGRAYNVTDGQPVRWAQLFRLTARLMGRRPLFLPLPGRPLVLLASALHPVARLAGARAAALLHPGTLRAFLRHGRYSIERARRELGYEPEVPLEEGLTGALDQLGRRGG